MVRKRARAQRRNEVECYCEKNSCTECTLRNMDSELRAGVIKVMREREVQGTLRNLSPLSGYVVESPEHEYRNIGGFVVEERDVEKASSQRKTLKIQQTIKPPQTGQYQQPASLEIQEYCPLALGTDAKRVRKRRPMSKIGILEDHVIAKILQENSMTTLPEAEPPTLLNPEQTSQDVSVFSDEDFIALNAFYAENA